MLQRKNCNNDQSSCGFVAKEEFVGNSRNSATQHACLINNVMQMSSTENLLEVGHVENAWEFFRKDPFSDQSINFARTVAAYYLGLPLLVSIKSKQLPSLYEWPKLPSEIDLDNFVVLKRICIAKAISTTCDERTASVLLWACNRHVEAIYYCDQFRDLKSQALLRFLEEQLTGLKLLEVFCESRIDIAFEELDNLTGKNDIDLAQTVQLLWSKLANSLFQMDSIAETQTVNSLHNRILAKMCSIHATMPVFVDGDIPLPRPPVYMCATISGDNEEGNCNVRLWILIQAYAYLLSDANVLHACIEHFFWCFLKFNEQCEVVVQYFDRSCTNKSRYETLRTKPTTFWLRGFVKFILVILRLITRDIATLEYRRNVELTKWTTVKYHNLLNVGEDKDEDLLTRWIKTADSNDFEQLNYLFDYLRKFRSSFAHMSEFCQENIACWRDHLLKKVILQKDADDSKMQQYLNVNISKTLVPDEILVKAEYLAYCWSYPTFPVDEKLLAMNLKLRPTDFVCSIDPKVALTSLQQQSVIEFVRRSCCNSVPDLRYHAQHRPITTSRSFPVLQRYSLLQNVPETKKLDSWRKLDDAMQKMNAVISEVEQELESTSCYVKVLLNNQQMEYAGSRANAIDDSGRFEHNNLSKRTSRSRTLFSSSAVRQYELINEDRYSLDSNHEPQHHPEIERLNFELLSPQPTVRNIPLVNDVANMQEEEVLPPPTSISQISQRPGTDHSSLPIWLKLLPTKQKEFLLSLTPLVNQIKDPKEAINVAECSGHPQTKSPKIDKMPSNALKFKLVTPIASTEYF